MKIPSSGCPRFAFAATLGAFESIRPTATGKILATCRFIGEPVKKLLIGAGVVFPPCRVRPVVHAARYYWWGPLASSGYPLLVLFMSGYAADVITAKATLASDAAFLQKPFSIKSLADTVKSVLGS